MAEGKPFHLQIRLSMGGKLQQRDRDLFSDSKTMQNTVIQLGNLLEGKKMRNAEKIQV